MEILYHEAEYSLSLLLRLHNILKDKRITKDKDVRELIELGNHGLPDIRNRFEELLNQVTSLENEKAALNTEIMELRNSIYTNNEIIRNFTTWVDGDIGRLFYYPDRGDKPRVLASS